MNKFAILGIALVIIIVGGILYKEFVGSADAPIETGVVKEFTIVSKKLEWRFEPESIEVEQGDRIIATVINEDNFDHGFAIDAFGISQRLPADGTIVVEFVATKSGEFPFYCSVSCSSSDNSSFGLADGEVQTGPYAGTVQGHFEHVGKFVVKALQAVGLMEEDEDHTHDDTHAH
ncbi:MAG: plastocyanin [Acidimicrobiales bacterium]|jgi:plastocyanin